MGNGIRYVLIGNGYCKSNSKGVVQYCSRRGISPGLCKQKCDNSPDCVGFNPDSGRMCVIHYRGSWDDKDWENEGCHNSGIDALITGGDGYGGGMCWKKIVFVS